MKEILFIGPVTAYCLHFLPLTLPTQQLTTWADTSLHLLLQKSFMPYL